METPNLHQEPQPEQLPNMGMHAAGKIEQVARGAAGLDAQPLFGLPNTFPDFIGDKSSQNALDKVLGNAIARSARAKAEAEDAARGDQTERARALRLLGVITDTVGASRGGVNGEGAGRPEETATERFMRLSLSGEEARASLAEVLGSIKSNFGDVVRGRFSLPPASEEADTKSETAAAERNENGFIPEEEGVAALVIATCIGRADFVAQQGKMVRPSVLLGGEKVRSQIEAAVLADDKLVDGTDAQKRAILDSVYAKLPVLMGEAFERQQAAVRQAASDANKL